MFRVLGGVRGVVGVVDPEMRVEVTRWYDPPSRAWHGSLADAAAELRELLADSVRLCLRSDVPVGTCLSGGIDSSAIACLVQRELDERGRSDAQVTVTAAFDGHPTNEWPFAKLVVDATGARSIRILPTAERLREELGRHLWHMDEPYDGMCQFTQWCVFAAVAGAGLKVALDGQGSDEHFAGYSGATDVAFLASLLRNMKLPSLVRESRALNGGRLSASSRALGLALRDGVPAIGRLYPRRFRAEAPAVDWVGFAAELESAPPPRDLAECLRRQVEVTSLPALLRYEDRNSMAASVEGRVPFLDHRVTELVNSFPDSLKIDKGVKKVVLRESMQGIIPDAVLARRDKLGYATPELHWLRSGGGDWVDESIRYALDAAPGVLDPDRARAAVMEVVDGRRPYTGEPWRIICYGFWLKEVVDAAWAAESCEQRGAAAWRHTL
jgi:asparagine synthase (glutamine-hydrolysing)